MKPQHSEFSSMNVVERRIDGPVEAIDEAVVLATIDGIGPAMDHMKESGVSRDVALRVLAAPQYHRRPSSSTIVNVLLTIRARRR